LAEALAYFKARSVQAIFPDELILGADTVVALGGRVYGKADDVEAARTMLRALSGQRQEVITGVAVLLPAEDRHGQDARATHGRDAHAMPPGHGQDARATHGRDAHATRQNAHDSPHSRGRLCHNGRDAHATGEDAHAPERRLLAHEVTYVTMRAMSEAEIQQYLDSGEWRDKAGAYAIQETADRFVQSVEGSLTNVVGLPMELVARLLRQARTGRRNDR
jgi:predicted house-cleaning NTP pyrophosphatase (Maf/HAM1 superfamily)